MGRSSSAIIAYGIDLGENPKFLEEYDYDFDEFLREVGSLPSYGEEGYSYEKFREFQSNFAIELILYGFYDVPYYLLAIAGTKDEVDWGAKEIEFKGGLLQGESRNKLKAFWDKYVVAEDLEFEQYEERPEWHEPTWYFASLYG